jgi:hypothetical protein
MWVESSQPNTTWILNGLYRSNRVTHLIKWIVLSLQDLSHLIKLIKFGLTQIIFNPYFNPTHNLNQHTNMNCEPFYGDQENAIKSYGTLPTKKKVLWNSKSINWSSCITKIGQKLEWIKIQKMPYFRPSRWNGFKRTSRLIYIL